MHRKVSNAGVRLALPGDAWKGGAWIQKGDKFADVIGCEFHSLRSPADRHLEEGRQVHLRVLGRSLKLQHVTTYINLQTLYLDLCFLLGRVCQMQY